MTTTQCPVTEDYENNDIGTPIPGSTCYVLDEHLNLVPDYFPGELYIGGQKLMNGYLNRPDLNEQTLIANPYVSEADRKAGLNLRLYKTGDCVTRRSDGHLIFQGRLDNQVKLHGFRIELGEIENVLRLHPSVLQVAAVVSEDNICAFVQTQGGDESGELKQELHALCEQKLPIYMIPARWYVVDSLPVNNSGKIDRKRLRSEAALRIPDTGPTTDKPATPPSSFSASLVLLLAQQMLHDNSITTDTDLLQAGMNSIDIMTLVNQVNAMGIARIGVSQVYEQKCISRIVSQTHQPYFWASPYAEDKPVIVLVTGDVLLRMEMFKSWLQDYSVLVFESFCEFFYRKEVNIHTLLAHYEEVVLPLMRTNPVILTGFCSNSEIAMRLAKRITDRHPELPKPHVVMMDAFQYREPEEISPEDAANTVASHRNRILIPLCNQIGRLAYDGPVLLFQSHTPIYNVDPDQGEITDPDTRRDIERMFRTNLQNWRTHFTDAPLYLIEKDHWHFLCKETLQFVADKMKAHWKDMRG
ncbi:MAG: non-ribosomal peptide synthetase [Bacteroidaceae bacterium]|nr:non-ribosomal peptide synthetase [Bacteroidaceae bacterium]